MRFDGGQTAAVEGAGDEGPRGVVQVLRHGRHAVAVRVRRHVSAPAHRVRRPAVQLRRLRRAGASWGRLSVELWELVSLQ